MLKGIITFWVLFFSIIVLSQPILDKLTVEKIMRDPKWIGSSPSSPQWSADGKTIFFNWNPEKADADSLYYITLDNKTPVKATVIQKQNLLSSNTLEYNKAKTAYTYNKDGDIFYTEIKTGKTRRITETIDSENNPRFSFNDSKIVYTRSQNLYAWDIASGETQQLTNLKSNTVATAAGPAIARSSPANSSAKAGAESGNQQEAWLKRDQLQYFEVLRSRKEKKDKADTYTKDTKQKELR